MSGYSSLTHHGLVVFYCFNNMDGRNKTRNILVVSAVAAVILGLWLIWEAGKWSTPSLQSRLVTFVLRLSRVKHNASLYRQRDLMTRINRNLLPSIAEPPHWFHSSYHVSRHVMKGGFTVYRVRPRTISLTRPQLHRQKIMYLHGGGYTVNMNGLYWRSLVKWALDDLQCEIVVPIYGCAPAYSYHDLLALMDETYQWMLAQREHDDERIILMGDSAGGNACLMLAQRLAERCKREPLLLQPSYLLLFCPWLDPSNSIDTDVWRTHGVNPYLNMANGVIAANWFTRDESLVETPLCTLLHPIDDISSTMVVVTGTHDVLYPQSLLLQRKARLAKKKLILLEFEKQMHDFVLLPMIIPEARSALHDIESVLFSDQFNRDKQC
jgi:acetyl esterase/lipase